MSNNESNIGRGKAAGYKLPGHTTHIERPKFYSWYDKDCFLARSLCSLCKKQYDHINGDHTQHQHDEQNIAL